MFLLCGRKKIPDIYLSVDYFLQRYRKICHAFFIKRMRRGRHQHFITGEDEVGYYQKDQQKKYFPTHVPTDFRKKNIPVLSNFIPSCHMVSEKTYETKLTVDRFLSMVASDFYQRIKKNIMA